MSLCRLALICLENTAIFWPDDLGVAQRTFLSLYMRSFLLYREYFYFYTSMFSFVIIIYFFFVSTGLQQYPFFSQHTQRFWCTLNHQIPNYKTRSGQYSASEFIINRSYTFFLYMQNLIIFNFTHIDRYETCIDTEIQQRAVQLFIFNSTLAKILNF